MRRGLESPRQTYHNFVIMKTFYKYLLSIITGTAVIGGGYIGISGKNLRPDFLPKNASGEKSRSIPEFLNKAHRSRSGKHADSASLKSKAKVSPAQTQNFQCVVTYSDSWTELSQEPGVYTFDTTMPISLRQAFVSDEYIPSGGAFFTDNYYILTTVSQDWFSGEIDVYSYKYTRNDWEEISYAVQDLYSLYNCICYDPIDNLAYGYFFNDEVGDWGYMDVNTLKVTHLSPMSLQLVALAINEKGEAYGVGTDGVFYSVDKKTGDLSKIGDTGLAPEYMQSTAFGQDGTLYWAASEEDSSGLYTIDVATGNASLVGAFPNNEEISALYSVYSASNNRVPAMATDLKADVSGIDLTFPFSFTVPTRNYGGSSLSGEVEYVVSIDGITAAKGNAEPGAEVSISLTVEKPGYHLVKVDLSNADGQSEPATLRSWIGVDQPKAVRNAKIEKSGDSSITISWTAPSGGVNNGYFNADMLTYTVTRLPERKVVAENLKATSFTDNIELTEGQSLIRYLVTPVADGIEGPATETSGVVIGKPYQVPVEFTFDNEEDYNIFTVIDNNETVTLDSGLWQFTPSGEAAGYVGGTKDGDDWLITPSVYLKARTEYMLSHDVLCYADNWPEEYSVYLGTSPDIDGMTRQLVAPTTIWWDEYRTKTETFTVDQDGIYYIGFHATSDAGSAFFLLDNIKLRELYSVDSPAAVKDLKVTAGELGAASAFISFTTPANTVGEAQLDGQFSAEIMRDGILIETITGLNPDEEVSYEDKNPKDCQMNSYTVVCLNSYGKGPEENAAVWVGLDTPSEPVDAAVTLDASGHPVISWKAPEGRGVHGGYVDNEDLSYTVAIVKDGALTPVAEMIDALSCVDEGTVLENTGTQMMHQYFIVPYSNAKGEYGNNASPLYISGKPYALPFKESFAGKMPTNFWAFTGTNGESWYIGDDWSVGSQDNDDGVLSYLPAVPEVTTTAMSGKIDISTAVDPKLTFYLRKMGISDNGFYDTDPSKDILNIKIGVDGFSLKTIESIRLADIKKMGEYIYYSIPLAEIGAKDFIVIAFEYEAVSDRTPIMIDNIQVKNACAYNAVAGEVTAPEAVEVYEPFSVNAAVTNAGDNELAEVKVSLMRGETVEAETTVSNLAPDQSATVTLEAEATPEWGDTAELTIRVTSDGDEVEADNMSDPFSVRIIYHDRPAVNDLTAEISGETLTLRWSEPEGLEQLETSVTESFESYKHGDLSFGDWKSEDKSFWGFEGIKTVTVDGKVIEIPNSDDAQAFMVFNPAMAGIDFDESPEWEPVSGDNLIVSFGDAANDELEANNDWLISPELSGKSQTISFWARTAAKKGKPDDIRVLVASEIEYNNNGTVKSSCFTPLQNGDINLTREWVKYEFTLPAGTKYFAIQNISDDGFAVMIDDITYEPFLEKTNANFIGYNIYLDETRLNAEPITDTFYTISDFQTGKYMVRVVYDEGESADSNIVNLNSDGVRIISGEETEGILYDLHGYRVTTPEPGRIYIRRKGNSSFRVMIRK